MNQPVLQRSVKSQMRSVSSGVKIHHVDMIKGASPTTRLELLPLRSCVKYDSIESLFGIWAQEVVRDKWDGCHHVNTVLKPSHLCELVRLAGLAHLL